jgi:hypothetical protein
MVENYFVKVLIPLKGALKRVQLVWASNLEIIFCVFLGRKLSREGTYTPING